MPKRTDISSILVIGAGPIVIGQACEFDYSGVQAIKALKEEGYRIILVNSNPATIMTDPDLPSGSDRIHAAVQEFDPAGDHDHIVNLQGDLPALDPAVVRTALEPLRAEGVDIATLVAEIQDPAEITDPNAVKAIVAFAPGQSVARALYFTRAAAPHGDGPYWHHIGIYAYRRAALARFVALQPSLLEQRERLEQLRALENHMRIDAARVDAVPLGVDTPEDLEKVRQQFADGAFASFTGTGFMGRG